MMSKNEIKLFDLSYPAYRQYCSIVKGNETTSFELAQRKLTRNILLSLKNDLQKRNNKVLYMYGKLHIFTKGNKIYWIKNNQGRSDWFYKDVKGYGRLNEELGINDLERELYETVY